MKNSISSLRHSDKTSKMLPNNPISLIISTLFRKKEIPFTHRRIRNLLKSMTKLGKGMKCCRRNCKKPIRN
jgi:hypothetical protein